jgi:hypothetical protein
MYKKGLLLLCVVLMASPALAVKWIGGASGDWNAAANWDTGLVPAAGETVTVDMVASDFDTAGWDAYINWSTVGDEPSAMGMAMLNNSFAGWTNQTITIASTDVIPTLANVNIGVNKMSRGTLNINANLAVTGQLAVGPDDYTGGTINQYSGAVTANNVRIPRRYNGEYNIYGGTLTVTEILLPRNNSGWSMDFWLGKLVYDEDGEGPGLPVEHFCKDGHQPFDYTYARLNISPGAVVQANSIKTSQVNPVGVVTITRGGKLILIGDQTVKVQALIASHQLTTPSGAAPGYYLEGGNTIVIPEPATMLMLGLGAFGLIRRKK